MSVKKKSAKGAGTPQGTKANKSTTIVSKIIDIVNLSDEEIKQSAVKKLADEDKQINNSNRYISADYCKQMMTAKQAQHQAEEQADNLQQIINSNRTKLDSLKAENKELSDEVEELRNRPIEVTPVDNSDSERRLQETIKSLERENIKRNEELERQYREDEQAVRKMLAKDKQDAIDQLTAEYEEKLKALQQAQPQSEIDDKEVFKAYFKTAFDSFNRMVEFAESSTNKDIFKSKINNLITAFSERNAKI